MYGDGHRFRISYLKSNIMVKRTTSALDKEEMATITGCSNKLFKQGFKTQFQASEEGLKSLETGKVYKPDQVIILNFYRFEGESDPSDNSILYAIETVTGEKGTLSDAYGVYADTNVTKFITEVEEIMKKRPGEKK
jgi:hypothetical protein